MTKAIYKMMHLIEVLFTVSEGKSVSIIAGSKHGSRQVAMALEHELKSTVEKIII